jgi:hypothetical protein
MLRPSLVLFLLGALSACAPAVDDKAEGGAEPTHAAYVGCPLDDADVVCADEQGCIATDAVARTTGFCSQECAVANDCPDDVDGRTKVCEQPSGASASLCYVTCPSASSTCPDGMVCADLTAQAGTALRLCVPRD